MNWNRFTSPVMWLGLWAVVAATPLAGLQNSACSSCHDQAAKLAKSVHAEVACDTCHSQHEEYPHPSGIPKPACADCHEEIARQDALGVHGQARSHGNAGAPDCGVCHGDAHELQRPFSLAFRKSVPETCGMCHNEVVRQFLTSVHGKALEKGISNAPICTDCHGEHSILSHSRQSSPVNASHIPETCGRCHGDVRLSRKFGLPTDRILSFQASYHGLASKAGSQSVANCASCHGYHNILPSSDPKSMVYPANLPKTCGQCHPGAGQRFAIGTVHLTESGEAPPAVRWVRNLYRVLIPLLIGLMLLHNVGDWLRKLVRLRLRNPALAGHPPAFRLDSPDAGLPMVRMYKFERVQHALMVVSFAVLVWTGFALKYPDQLWARPLLAWENLFPVRATVHRIAGAVMIGVSLVHLISLSVNARLRKHWREMWPRMADVTEALQGFAYTLGLRRQSPQRSAHSYVEKAEYWAVIWGTAVMVLTGVMLWAVNYTLQWLPKAWLDLATSVHFYEAVLATLAIVVWHLYSVIFDPEVYPLDTAWLTGLSVRKYPSHEQAESSGQDPASHDL